MSAPVSFADKVRAAWGNPPDWIVELAAFTDSKGTKAAGVAIGYSYSAVSMVLNNKGDKLDLERFEERVRGALMGLTVDCPARGDMTRDVCLDWQRKPFAATSAGRVEMYRACRAGCPHSKLTGAKDE